MATTQYYTHISEIDKTANNGTEKNDIEEPYDWRVGPCAGMTWHEWVIAQGLDFSADDNQHDEPEWDNTQGEELICPPTPRASQSVKRQLFKSPPKGQSIQHNHPITSCEAPIEKKAVQPFEVPQKVKTRAQRRAADNESDDEIDNGSNSDFITPKKKERRTAYWALQDDLRIKRAKRERALNSEDFTSGGTYQVEPVSFGEDWDLTTEYLLTA